jgi:predicted regulator of Ras-like GTPase activity (Roadblock/LC7/MglB family)
VLRGLPNDLKDRVRDLDIRGATMTISLERILSQLPSGSVKISFGSLRHAAPQLFSAGSDCDSRDVALPLDEILAKINPAMVCPPHGQSARGPIESEDRGASDTPASGPSGLQSPARASSLSVPPVVAPGEIAPEPVSTTPRTTPKPAAKAPPIRVPTPQTAKPAETSSVSVQLASLSENWPAKLREEIAQWNLPKATVALPAETVRAAMKAGQVVFSWQTLRSWINPQPPVASSIDDNTKLELPIAVLTPLLFAGQKQPAKPARMAALDEIPDLFFDGRKSESSNGQNKEEAPAIPVPSPSAAAVESPMAVAAAVPKAQSAPKPSQAASDEGVMRIPLKSLTELWPENMRAEVGHWNLDQLMVALPADRINAALKQGKVVFSWENLRSWIYPTPPSATSLRPEALLELPLPVIMPVFLAGRKLQGNSTPKPCPVIDDDIPDPFADFLPQAARTSGVSKAQETPPLPPPDKAPPPKAKASEKPLAKPTRAQKSGSANPLPRERTSAPSKSPAEVQPEVEKTAGPKAPPSPAEVLASAVGLQGVAGALVALSDGFKVASKLPPGLDGDALAAFLPHIFSKVNQSARELRMGDLNNLNFTVDNIPWKIFRVNQIFFAALGHAGQPMPTDQLAALAHKLSFKN